MVLKSTEIHKFRDGRLHLYKREDCKFWMCRFYADGKYKTTSTKETSFSSGKRFAEDWYDKLRFDEKHGVPIHGRKFGDVVDEYIEYQETLIGGNELSVSQSKDYKTRLLGKLSFFHDHNIQSINSKLLYQYRDARLKEVSFNSIKHDFVALRQVLNLALQRDYIKSKPDFPTSSKRIPTNPKPSFSKDEWKELQKVSRERIQDAPDKNKRYKREQLHDYMMWMVHTGCRVAETLRTTYGSVMIKTNENNEEETNITIRGKTGIRKIRGTTGSVSVYRRLCNRHPKHKKTDFLFPYNHKDGLNNLLDAANLKKSSFGTRNAKSFRSTYMMFRLGDSGGSEKIMTFLARNCGTSQKVISDFYTKHFGVDQFDASVVSLPKSTTKPKSRTKKKSKK